MSSGPFSIAVLTALLSLIVGSGGMLVWLSPVDAQSLTPAQNTLISTADWMIKACAGAILGFAGGMRLAGRGEAGAASV